jgi:2-amino-4-hydroxy-6-hydroxymethyldihydropteridine diphosphokinase
MNTVILGLGSNIAPEKNLPKALQKLSRYARIAAVSSLWKTAAVGSSGPAFLNAAVQITIAADLNYLKMEILSVIETSLGRVRVADKNAARTIDLDILVFNQEVIDKNIFRFDHLILPLAELIPELKDKDSRKTLAELACEHCCKPTAVNIGKLIY